MQRKVSWTLSRNTVFPKIGNSTSLLTNEMSGFTQYTNLEKKEAMSKPVNCALLFYSHNED